MLRNFPSTRALSSILKENHMGSGPQDYQVCSPTIVTSKSILLRTTFRNEHLDSNISQLHLKIPHVILFEKPWLSDSQGKILILSSMDSLHPMPALLSLFATWLRGNLRYAFAEYLS